MKKRICFFFLGFLLLFLCGCGRPLPAQTKTAEGPETAAQEEDPEEAPEKGRGPVLSGKSKVTMSYFGTVCAMYVWDDFSVPEADRRFQAVWNEAKELLTEIENAVSLSREGSDVRRFNGLHEGESAAISEHTAKIIKTAKKAYEETGGLYDPSVFPLVDLWGFSPRFSGVDGAKELPISETYPPEEEYIEAFAALADFSGIELTENEDGTFLLTKNIPSVTVRGVQYEAQLDLGGIAKGYAADEVTKLMERHGYVYGYFSCGGSSLSLLRGREEDGGVYYLGMRKPREGSAAEINYITVPAAECGLSTSGDYDHCRIRDGIRYCHIIDPGTGWPANTPAEGGRQKGIATATVLGEDSAYTDCISTALCLMEPDKAIEYINTHLAGCAVTMVFYDNREEFCEIVTNLQPDQYTLEDEAYRPACAEENGRIRYTGTLFRAS